MELLEHVLQASHAAAAAKYRRTDASLMPRRRPLPLRLQPAMTSYPVPSVASFPIPPVVTPFPVPPVTSYPVVSASVDILVRRPIPVLLPPPVTSFPVPPTPAMTSSPALVCAAVETVRRRRARLVVVAGSTLSDE